MCPSFSLRILKLLYFFIDIKKEQVGTKWLNSESLLLNIRKTVYITKNFIILFEKQFVLTIRKLMCIGSFIEGNLKFQIDSALTNINIKKIDKKI